MVWARENDPGIFLETEIEIDEWIWHFLSDADIRYKDSNYAETQVASVFCKIRERGRGA